MPRLRTINTIIAAFISIDRMRKLAANSKPTHPISC